MALIDESRQAFRELRAVMPATIEFNGVEVSGISHSINVKRMQQLQGDQIDATSEFEMEDTDFATFVTAGLKDKVSKVRVTMSADDPPVTEEFVYITKDIHPCSATVHVFLRR